MKSPVKFSAVKANPGDYLPPAPDMSNGSEKTNSVSDAGTNSETIGKIGALSAYLKSSGLIYEPWQVAAYVTAVRTKPFVVLAGISGTGKTKLPRLVAEATGAEFMNIPVRPDWTDSSDLLGYERINGEFVPGIFLSFAKRAMENPEKQFFFLLDEMNIARVEHYFAEILSHIEERKIDSEGRITSEPLLSHLASRGAEEWRGVRLPDNLCIVGAVNMDESTQGFSRKVLDRAFVIELSTVDLAHIPSVTNAPKIEQWPSSEWRAQALALGSHPKRTSASVQKWIEELIRINEILEGAQLQFGYRLRDEVIMFCLAAEENRANFITSEQIEANPFDLAVGMKILPRIQGSGSAVKKVLEELAQWAAGTANSDNTPGESSSAYPFTEQRLIMMNERIGQSGYTSYWL